MSDQYGLRVANVFHAGDGNLHPLILYDANKPGELDRAEAFGADILRALRRGRWGADRRARRRRREARPDGHDVQRDDLKQQQRLKCAFDPDALLNPGKVFPMLHRCAELGRMHVHRGQVRFPELPRSDRSATLAVQVRRRMRNRCATSCRWAAAEEQPLELVGRRLKRGLGAADAGEHTLDLSGARRHRDYDPRSWS